MTKIRWGIIGCGDVTEIKSGPALQLAENSELVAVMRRDAAKAQDYAARHKVPRWYNDAEKLVNDPEVNAVYIATPPDTHRLYTEQAAAAGKPVYVEKPMARSHTECIAMIESCRRASVPLFTAYYRRSLPRFLKVKALLEEGAIGQVRFVRTGYSAPPSDRDFDREQLPWRLIPEIAGGGYFVDLASHTFDILDYYFGPVGRVKAFADNQAGLYPAEDMVACVFTFENGITGTGIWCFTAGQKSDEIEISGEKGKIAFSTFSQDPIRLITGKYTEQWDIKNPKHIQLPHIKSVVASLNGTGICPSDGISAARTNRVLDDILQEWRDHNNLRFD